MSFTLMSRDATALHHAAEKGSKEVIQALLLAKQVEIDACARADWIGGTSWGVTPLHLAIQEDHAEIVELLLAHGADANRQRTFLVSGPGFPEFHDFPLHQAKSRPVAALLLAAGADVNARATDGSTPLHRFALNADSEAIRFLLQMGADLHARTDDGATPLHRAATTGANIEVLLQAGAQVNTQTLDGSTPLHVAVRGRSEAAVQALIYAGSDLTLRNCRGETPLHVALSSLLTKDIVSETLIAHGADVNARIEGGWTPVSDEVDCSSGSKLLREMERANLGATPLHLAARYRTTALVTLLLAKGANLHARADDGTTALHWAMLNSSGSDVPALLLAHGADLHAETHAGGTPLFAAAQSKYVWLGETIIF